MSLGTLCRVGSDERRGRELSGGWGWRLCPHRPSLWPEAEAAPQQPPRRGHCALCLKALTVLLRRDGHPRPHWVHEGPAASCVPEARTLPCLSAEGTEAVCPAAAPSAPRRPGTSEPGANPEPRCRQLGLKGPGRSPPSLPLAAPARSPRARVPAVVELVSLRPALPSAGVDPRLPLLTGDKAQPFQGPPRDARAHRLLPRVTLGASLVTWQGVLHLSASGRHG